MEHNLTKNVLLVRLPPDDGALTTWTLAGGTTNKTCPSVDTLGYDAFRFILSLGAITSGAATSIKLQQSSDNAVADDFSDIAGSAITIVDTDDNTVVITGIFRPLKRYVRLAILRATQNAAVDALHVELWRAVEMPVTQDATVSHTAFLNSPAEGSA